MIFNQPLYGSTEYGSPFLRNAQKQQASNRSVGAPPLGLVQQFSGGGSGSGISGLFGGGGFGGATGAAGSGSGLGSAAASAGPWAALAAAIALNENYQGNIGNRDGESFPLEYALTGRSLYKDAPGWGEKADEILPGLGSRIRTLGLVSSPVDKFRGDTYKDLWDEAKSGFGLFDLF